MERMGRWATAVLVSLLVFVGCVALLMGVRFPWTPHVESDRWLVALTVAAFLGTGIGGGLAWWAGREDAGGGDGGATGGLASAEGKGVTQRARVGRRSTNIMAGRDVRIRRHGERPDGRPDHEWE